MIRISSPIGRGEVPSPHPESSLNHMKILSTLTLEPGDMVHVPGHGTKQVDAILEIRPGRYQIKLIEKYKESVALDVSTTTPAHQRRR